MNSSSCRDGSSPHTRGAPLFACAYDRDVGIIPAYAGSTRESVPAVEPCWDHPRIRGEHHLQTWKGWSGNGSSPHTRGAPKLSMANTGLGGIIPAYAGSTKRSSPASAAQPDHPRIRGEHPPELSRGSARWGSSPHTRGALPTRPRPSGCRRIIPAYAGSTSGGSRRRRAP